MELITIVLTAIAMFLVQISIELWKNRNNKLDETNALLNKLIENFQAFVSDFMAKDSLQGKNPSDYFIRKSPIELSPAGKKLATKSGITEFINKNIKVYSRELDNYHNGLDILKCCRRISFKEFSQSKSNEIKNYFYNQGLSQLLMQEIFALALKEQYSQKIKSKR